MDLSATTYALVGAAAGTSYVLFSNVGLTQFGTIPLLNGRIADVKLSSADKVKAWAGYFYPAARWSLGPTFVSLLLDIYVNRTHPSPFIAQLSLASGIIGASIVPYTLLFIRETNSELIDLGHNEAAAATAKPARVDELIQTWEKRHIVRFAAYAGAWLCAMAALVFDGRTFVEVTEVVVV